MSSRHVEAHTGPLRIAVDATGGDYAPRNIIDGALVAARHLGVGIIFVGARESIHEELRRHGDAGTLDVSVVDAPDAIDMRESPASALRRKPRAAVRLAADLVAKGEAVFAKCTACHTVAQGAPNGIGPNLWGTVGEEIGHGKRGFAFSDALASHGGKWTFENLDEWLMSPRKFAPGTKMTFAGLSDPQDRADVILYLNQHGSNLPLPAPPPPGATRQPKLRGRTRTGKQTALVPDGSGR